MNDDAAKRKHAGNQGPANPDIVERAKEAVRKRSDDAERERIDPDAPARAVLFPDEDAPEPNEPG